MRYVCLLFTLSLSACIPQPPPDPPDLGGTKTLYLVDQQRHDTLGIFVDTWRAFDEATARVIDFVPRTKTYYLNDTCDGTLAAFIAIDPKALPVTGAAPFTAPDGRLYSNGPMESVQPASFTEIADDGTWNCSRDDLGTIFLVLRHLEPLGTNMITPRDPRFLAVEER